MIGWSVLLGNIKARLLFIIGWSVLFGQHQSEAVVLQPRAFDACNPTSNMNYFFSLPIEILVGLVE